MRISDWSSDVCSSDLASGADGEVLTPSETPRALSGDGDEAFVVEGPFSLAWQNAGGRFAVEATAEGADKPAAASSTQGNGSGRRKLRGEQRYRVTIAADGPWTITPSRSPAGSSFRDR